MILRRLYPVLIFCQLFPATVRDVAHYSQRAVSIPVPSALSLPR
ncbi:hypothetical protein SAMN05421823_111195 [Catalinimonas alkaloidigena]|uniref:Uncharacterized protein n=1 Tax=Catalinimonas alkaloidigena TaxID=1075417 RepID=A0A1G9RNR9_9BACT|nr:hypothetical protein [Catalinimonas alkaloidigena]SDM24035.1 hypothetical protein SAMN05421823_111195 [Catalinimonas alkaloidigena]